MYPPRYMIVSSQENEYIRNLYLSGCSLRQIAKNLNKSTTYVNCRVKYLNLKIHDKRCYFLDETYFKNIDNENKAYILGFIAGDGYLLNGRSKGFAITIKPKDIEVLEFIQQQLHTNIPIKKISNSGYVRNNHFIRLVVVSVAIFKDLSLWLPNKDKSFALEWPSISKQYNAHFLRGIVDADGCFFLVKTEKYHNFLSNWHKANLFHGSRNSH